MQPRDFSTLLEHEDAILTDQTKQELVQAGYAPMGRIDSEQLSPEQMQAEMHSWKSSYGGRCKFAKDGDHIVVMVHKKVE